MTLNFLKLIKEQTVNVEVIDVKLNNRKTKKIGGKKDEKNLTSKLEKIYLIIENQIKKSKKKKILNKFKN